MQAKAQALFEIPNCTDDGVGGTDQLVASGGDAEREIRGCVRVQLGGLPNRAARGRVFARGECMPVPFAAIFSLGRQVGEKLYLLYFIYTGFYMTYIV
jgi:hypothetical protein